MSSSTDDHLTLDDLGVLVGTDKNCLTGDYLRHYEAMFGHLRHAEFNLIEIGVFNGASIRMWQRYFSRARIIGIDSNPACKTHETDRARIIIGSIESPELLFRVAADYPATVIIDDASHQADHQIFAFERLFPALLPGGFYSVEDLHFQLTEPDASRLRGNSPVSSVEYFARIASLRLASDYQRQKFQGLDAYFAGGIESMQYIKQGIILRKAATPPAIDDEIARLLPLVQQSGDWLNWLILGNRLRELDRIPEATNALRTAVTLKPDFVVARERLSELLDRCGDLRGAVEALEPAVALAGTDTGLRTRLADRVSELRSRMS